MKTYVVIDTNVLVSALMSRHPDSSTVQVVEYLLNGEIIPLFNDEILLEYNEVLRRPKFRFPEQLVRNLVNQLVSLGISLERTPADVSLPDPKDVVFYEVALSKDGSFLVTGNTKHFPVTPIVVTPAQLLDIILERQLLVMR